MEDLNDKITGNDLTAAEWNQVPSEIQNVIEGTGQTLSGADLNQLDKGLAQYAAAGQIYVDSGAADAYVLSAGNSRIAIPFYVDRAKFLFVPSNANTGASTVNIGGLGVKDLKDENGVALTANRLTDKEVTIEYILGSDEFRITAVRGQLIQVVEATPYTTYSSHTTVIPRDDTIPQNTEGEEIIIGSITPKSSTNRLRITTTFNIIESEGANNIAIIALYQDSTANALTASEEYTPSGSATQMMLIHEMAAGTTSLTTFKIRSGPGDIGTLYVNGESGGRRFGGISAVRMRIEEIAV